MAVCGIFANGMRVGVPAAIWLTWWRACRAERSALLLAACIWRGVASNSELQNKRAAYLAGHHYALLSVLHRSTNSVITEALRLGRRAARISSRSRYGRRDDISCSHASRISPALPPIAARHSPAVQKTRRQNKRPPRSLPSLHAGENGAECRCSVRAVTSNRSNSAFATLSRWRQERVWLRRRLNNSAAPRIGPCTYALPAPTHTPHSTSLHLAYGINTHITLRDWRRRAETLGLPTGVKTPHIIGKRGQALRRQRINSGVGGGWWRAAVYLFECRWKRRRHLYSRLAVGRRVVRVSMVRRLLGDRVPRAVVFPHGCAQAAAGAARLAALPVFLPYHAAAASASRTYVPHRRHRLVLRHYCASRIFLLRAVSHYPIIFAWLLHALLTCY